ncbi:MAG: oxidoreductase [Planctomycetaceae bacterium]|nr:oxidoreductase [Planctomycetaceae bacterium]
MASHHAEYNFDPYLRIRAICDVDAGRSTLYNNRFGRGEAEVHGDYRGLLHRADIDAFVICTPDHWHAKIAVEALRSGKDVYCEKPLTLTVAEGKLIHRALSETDRVLQVGTQQRSDPAFQMAVALARSGRLGRIVRVTAAIGAGPTGGPFPTTEPPPELDWDRWLGQAPETPYIAERCHGNFRWWYEYSGGKMTDWGAHHVDIACWAIEPLRYSSVAIAPVERRFPVPLENGRPCVADCYNTPTTFRVECRFEDGPELVIRDSAPDLGFDNGVLFECEGGRFFVNRGKLTGRPIEELESLPLPEETLAALRRGRGVMPHVANFYWSCRERSSPISSAAEHLVSLNICHVANIALRLDRSVDWSPANESLHGDDQVADAMLSRTPRDGFEIA